MELDTCAAMATVNQVFSFVTALEGKSHQRSSGRHILHRWWQTTTWQTCELQIKRVRWPHLGLCLLRPFPVACFEWRSHILFKKWKYLESVAAFLQFLHHVTTFMSLKTKNSSNWTSWVSIIPHWSSFEVLPSIPPSRKTCQSNAKKGQKCLFCEIYILLPPEKHVFLLSSGICWK